MASAGASVTGERVESGSDPNRLVQGSELLEDRAGSLQELSSLRGSARRAGKRRAGHQRFCHLIAGVDLLENPLGKLELSACKLWLSNNERFAKEPEGHALKVPVAGLP